MYILINDQLVFFSMVSVFELGFDDRTCGDCCCGCFFVVWTLSVLVFLGLSGFLWSDLLELVLLDLLGLSDWCFLVLDFTLDLESPFSIALLVATKFMSELFRFEPNFGKSFMDVGSNTTFVESI